MRTEVDNFRGQIDLARGGGKHRLHTGEEFGVAGTGLLQVASAGLRIGDVLGSLVDLDGALHDVAGSQ